MSLALASTAGASLSGQSQLFSSSLILIVAPATTISPFFFSLFLMCASCMSATLLHVLLFHLWPASTSSVWKHNLALIIGACHIHLHCLQLQGRSVSSPRRIAPQIKRRIRIDKVSRAGTGWGKAESRVSTGGVKKYGIFFLENQL